MNGIYVAKMRQNIDLVHIFQDMMDQWYRTTIFNTNIDAFDALLTILRKYSGLNYLVSEMKKAHQQEAQAVYPRPPAHGGPSPQPSAPPLFRASGTLDTSQQNSQPQHAVGAARPPSLFADPAPGPSGMQQQQYDRPQEVPSSAMLGHQQNNLQGFQFGKCTGEPTT